MSNLVFIHISATSNDVFTEVLPNDLLMYNKTNNAIFIGSSNTPNYLFVGSNGTRINNSLSVKGELSIENQGVEIVSPSFIPDHSITSSKLVNDLTLSGDIIVNGNLNVTNRITYGSIQQTSDRRLKNNIENIKDATNILQTLIPVTYTKDNEKEAGFIAQDILENTPELSYFVCKGKDIDIPILSLNYIGFISYIVKSIQEINERLTNLEVSKQ